MSSYEEQRQKQIAKNKALFTELRLQQGADALHGPHKTKAKSASKPPAAKRRKIEGTAALPQRISARIAGAEVKPVYIDEEPRFIERVARPKISKQSKLPRSLPTPPADNPKRSADDIERLRVQWSDWKPTAAAPTRDEDGTFHFNDSPDFTPNKSPEEMLREGCFGGTYWRPLYSKALGITIQDDWRELPEEWAAGLDVERYLTSSTYEPEVNKYGVSSGQSIEEWEANGWIEHEFDVRGWFQWYCRFFLGRRCRDDDRQIGRWKKVSHPRSEV